MDCMDWIEGFTQDCQARGMTRHAIETYRSQVKAFLEANDKPTEVNLDELRSFLTGLRDKNLSDSSLKGYFAAISAFYDYLVFERLLQSNPVLPFRKRYLARLKVHGEIRQLISIQDLQLLISSAAEIREKAILMVLAKTGMRRGEFMNLKPEDLDFDNDIIHIPEAAKRSNRIAFMDDELKIILLQYLSWRSRRAKTPYLWISKHGGRIHKDYPGQVLAELGAALRLHNPEGPLNQRLSPHCLRHFFTTWLYRAGMDPEYLKWLRGDSLSSEAWEIYNHIDIEEVRIEYLRRIPKLISFDRKITAFLSKIE